MEFTNNCCVLMIEPTLIVLALMKKVLSDRARMSGKSINPSPVSNVIVLTVRFDIVALDANNELIVTLLELNVRPFKVEKLEKDER